jgi:hypothetical protein
MFAFRQIENADQAGVLFVLKFTAFLAGMLFVISLLVTFLRGKPLVGGAKKVTCPPGAAAAMARMKGRCQMTSPIPGLTWMTALAVTLIAVSRVAICPL